jgi:hypothetical protein
VGKVVARPRRDDRKRRGGVHDGVHPEVHHSVATDHHECVEAVDGATSGARQRIRDGLTREVDHGMTGGPQCLGSLCASSATSPLARSRIDDDSEPSWRAGVVMLND